MYVCVMEIERGRERAALLCFVFITSTRQDKTRLANAGGKEIWSVGFCDGVGDGREASERVESWGQV